MFFKEKTLHRTKVETPLGPLWGGILPSGELAVLEFEALSPPWAGAEDIQTPESRTTAAALERQLSEYFAKKRRVFQLPLRIRGTSFQERIWKAISAVPFGGIATYAQLAAAADSPRACRAAGTATGSNPLTILVPCHRILPTVLYEKAQKDPDGLTETGNYGGGRWRKKELLRLEGVIP